MEKRVKISGEDIKIGVGTIADIDNLLIPNLRDETGKKTTLDAFQRRVLIAIKLLADLDGRTIPNGDYMSVEVNYEELSFVLRALEVVDKHWEGFIVLGGLISAIKEGQLNDLVNCINEHE